MSDISFNIDDTADTSFNISESTGIDFSISSGGESGTELFVYNNADQDDIYAAYQAGKEVLLIGDNVSFGARNILRLIYCTRNTSWFIGFDAGQGGIPTRMFYMNWVQLTRNSTTGVLTWLRKHPAMDCFKVFSTGTNGDFNYVWDAETEKYQYSLKRPVPVIPDETNNYVLKSIAGTLTWVQE